ncbi:MAG: ribosome maturation factor RimP [Bacteroidia bacterium]
MKRINNIEEGTKVPSFILKMDIIEQLKVWANEHLASHLFLVSIEQKLGSKKISVFVDGDNGVTIEECRLLSKHLSGHLDEMEYGEEPYTLEVSSPGAENSLKLFRQYNKHVGRELLITLTQNTELLGRLESIEGDILTLHLKDKKKDYKAKETILKQIKFNDIKESVVQLSFK